ncbi:MAG: hypothetical protein ACTHU0_16735 [Kofleriaceae bacterium]
MREPSATTAMAVELLRWWADPRRSRCPVPLSRDFIFDDRGLHYNREELIGHASGFGGLGDLELLYAGAAEDACAAIFFEARDLVTNLPIREAWLVRLHDGEIVSVVTAGSDLIDPSFNTMTFSY